MDLDLLEEFLKEHTCLKNNQLFYKPNGNPIKAIMSVHVLGNMCNMKILTGIAEKYGLIIIEDAAEALGSTFKGKHAGTFGKLGCLSFNGNKIITTGGGGMIITDDKELAKKAKHLTTQAKSDSFEYVHDEIGYNYRLVNVLAAMGVAQMEQLPRFLNRKKEIAAFYFDNLEQIDSISFQKIADDVVPNQWLFTIKTSQAKELAKHLNSLGIECMTLWVPMNRLPMFKDSVYYNHKDFSYLIYNSCLSIPCSTSITDEELKKVVEEIKKYTFR